MNATDDQIQFTAYGPERFAEHLPFARRGYLFTVPGSFPEDTPAHTNVTDWEMAVYRKHGEWEARDVHGERRVWAVGPTRREAAGLAFHHIARKRRYRAAAIADKRHACGLETVPPYAVEVTDGVTLVLTPQTIAHLVCIEETGFGRPADYRVTAPSGGSAYVIPAGAGVELRTLEVGVLHIRCGHEAGMAARFENEADALEYVREELTVWEICPKSPGAPVAEDQQPEDDEAAVTAVIARAVRRAYPTATELLVRAEDYTVTAVLANHSAEWTEHESELPDGMHFELTAYLADQLAGTKDPTELGWRESAKPGVFTVPLLPVAS